MAFANPPTLPGLLSAMSEPDAALRAVRPRLDGWPDALGGVRERLVPGRWWHRKAAYGPKYRS